ncbi:hypothetical protein GOODEAATRI_010550, partial [Goodea atripinnis]
TTDIDKVPMRLISSNREPELHPVIADKYLVKFLAKLAQDSEANKMTPSNISIVLGPNLLWAKTEGSLAEMAAATSVHVVAIIEPIIQHADWFFPEDVEFNVSGMFVMPTPASNHNHPDYDCSTIERKRPGSMVPGHGATQAPQSLAEAQPQPSAGGSGQDATQHSLVQGLAALAAAQQLLAQHTEELSNPKLRDSAPAPTPVPQRNGSGGGGSSGTSGTGSMGPSPHMTRRGTKKQAPAPPKPSNPPPGQPLTSVNYPSSSGSSQSLSPTSRPLSIHSPTSPASPTQQPCATPRRHSNNQPPIHAPNHPPPEPPTHPSPPATQPCGDQHCMEPSPPGTPTPPDTPPPPTAATTSQDAGAPPSQSPYQSGSLPRPRPVPKPRNRPSIPPPPQPTALSSESNGLCATAYKMMGGFLL